MNPTVVVTNTADGTSCTFTTANGLTASTSLHVDHLDIYTGCLTTPAEINGAQVSFQVHVTGGTVNVTSDLDGMQLDAQVTLPPSRAVFPNGCNPNAAGVQFVFGGDSRMYIPDGDMELCSGPAVGSSSDPKYTAQQIALYGIPPVPPMSASSVISNSATYPFCAINTGGAGQPACDPNGALKIDDVTQDASDNVTGDYGAQTARRARRPVDVDHREGLRAGAGDPSQHARGEDPRPGRPLGAGRHLLVLHVAANPVRQRHDQLQLVEPDRERQPATRPRSSVRPTTPSTSRAATTPRSRRPARHCGRRSSASTNSSFLSGAYTEHLDGDPAHRRARAEHSATTQVYAPENGCVAGIGSYPNYWDGISDTDCALLKWDSIGPERHRPEGAGVDPGHGVRTGRGDRHRRPGCPLHAGQTDVLTSAPCMSTADPSGAAAVHRERSRLDVLLLRRRLSDLQPRRHRAAPALQGLHEGTERAGDRQLRRPFCGGAGIAQAGHAHRDSQRQYTRHRRSCASGP